MIPFLDADGLFGAGVASVSHRSDPLRLIVVLEGKNDRAHLRRLSRILSHADRTLPNLEELSRSGTIAFITTGATSVCPIPASVCGLGPQEFHLYDRESGSTSRHRQQLVEAINRRRCCCALLTTRRTLENYLHPDAIHEARGIRVSFGPDDDVAATVARSALRLDSQHWEALSARTRRRLRCRAKQWLNRDAVECMTLQRVLAHDPENELIGWLKTIGELLSRSTSAPVRRI